MAYGDWVFWYLLALVLAIIVSALHERKRLKKYLHVKHPWLLLGVFVLALVIRLALPHFHYVFVDETWYLEAADSMAEMHKPLVCDALVCKEFMKSPGWSFLMSILFTAIGPGKSAAFMLSALLGALSVFPMYFIAKNYFGYKSGIIAALLLAVNPLHIFWSLTIEQIAAPLFILLCVIALFQARSFLTGSLLLAFALHMRVEFILLVPVVLFFRVPKKYWAVIAAGIIFDIPHIMIQHELQVGIYQAAYFTFMNFISHFIPALLILTGFVVLAIPAVFSKKFPLPVIAWLVLFAVLYISFTRTQERMLMFPMAALLLLTSSGLSRWKYGAFAAVLISVPLGIPLIMTDYSRFMLETELPGIVDVPDGCTLILEYPEVMALSGISTISSREYLSRHMPGCSYFLEDGFCLREPIAIGPGVAYKCLDMRVTFDMVKTDEYKKGETTYTLYKIN